VKRDRRRRPTDLGRSGDSRDAKEINFWVHPATSHCLTQHRSSSLIGVLEGAEALIAQALDW
jgi:hypothetical protein